MPDDPIIDDMDPVLRMWMFYNWIEDQNDDVELVKNHAYLLGSFWNPEAVQKLTGGGNTHSSTDEEFEASTKIIEEEKKAKEQVKEKESSTTKRRRRRKIQG